MVFPPRAERMRKPSFCVVIDCCDVHRYAERRPFAFTSCFYYKRLGVHKCSEHVYENICSARLSLASVLRRRWRFLCALLDKVPRSHHLTLKGEER